MDFTVDTQGLRGLPPLLTRLGDDATASDQYLRKHATVAWFNVTYGLPTGSLMLFLRPYHDRVVDAVSEHLVKRLHETADGDAERVGAMTRYYERVDTAAAARADAVLPGAAHPELLRTRPDPITQTPAFADILEPTDRLV